MILVAPDKFKGTLSASTVASAIGDALRSAGSGHEVIEQPIADGGDGTVDLALRTGMDPVNVVVRGPLGEPVDAIYARRAGLAVIESAAACGLVELPTPPDVDTAGSSSTWGVGELLAHVVSSGARKVIIGLGGSASTDGGAGLATALGARLLDGEGGAIPPGGIGLGTLDFVDLEPMLAALSGVEITLAIDVDNPLAGSNGAAAVFGPQKGADHDLIAALDRNLIRWAEMLRRRTGVDAATMRGCGAAGGAGLPLLACGLAHTRSGVEVMAELVGLDELVRTADLVVVGEGRLDQQSLQGKGPVWVARMAKSHGAVVVAAVGTNTLTDAQLAEASIDRVYAMTDVEPDRQRCLDAAESVLGRLASQLAQSELSAVVHS